MSNFDHLKIETRKIYGAYDDVFKTVPRAENREVAHELALITQEKMARFTADVVVTRAIEMKKIDDGIYDENPRTLAHDYFEPAADSILSGIAYTVEQKHAELAPEDFDENARSTGAYLVGKMLHDIRHAAESHKE